MLDYRMRFGKLPIALPTVGNFTQVIIMGAQFLLTAIATPVLPSYLNISFPSVEMLRLFLDFSQIFNTFVNLAGGALQRF